MSYFNLTLFLCCFVVDLLMLMLLYSYDVCWWSSYVVHLSLLILLYACYFYLWFIDLLTLISSTWSSHARPQRVFLLAGGGQISSAMSTAHLYPCSWAFSTSSTLLSNILRPYSQTSHQQLSTYFRFYSQAVCYYKLPTTYNTKHGYSWCPRDTLLIRQIAWHLKVFYSQHVHHPSSHLLSTYYATCTYSQLY